MISFGNYMQEWLYGKNGYYLNAEIGKKGDFYTSVSASRFFGGCIAYHILNLLEKKELHLPLKIIEFGSDKGYLITDISQFLSAISIGLEAEFMSIEPIEKLSRIQKDYFFKNTHSELKSYRDIADVNIDKNDCIFVLCNELFDAFSCEIVKDNQMAYINNHSLVWGEKSAEIARLCEKYNLNIGEVPYIIENFVKNLAGVLKKAKKSYFLSFDYGEWEKREDINLRIYKNHEVFNFMEISSNLSQYYTQSDITYDVNFSILDKEFSQNGAKRVFYETQAKTLINLGIIELLEKFAKQNSYESYLKEVNKIKPLISPGGLGERFKGISFVFEN